MRRSALGWSVALLALSLVAAPGRSAAEIDVPPGFRLHVYVTGEGFDSSRERGARGIPSVSTLGFDPAGVLYLARTGRRYTTVGESDDTWPLYRVPPGGARFSAKTEAQYLYGPPLPNAQIGTVRGERELFVTTYDRDRKIGVLYRVVNGRAELFAGGTPEAGAAPLLKQPEGTAVDASGALYVADRIQGTVLKLDAAGRVLRERYAELTRPRVVVPDGAGGLWIGADGGAEAPWQQGEGEIWRVSADGAPRRMLQGPIPQAMAVSPGGNLLVADRHGGHVFALTPDGVRVDFMRFADGDAPRSLAVAPVTPETERAGIAGQLFVVAIRSSTWPVNEVLRVSGAIDEFVRERRGRPASP